MSDARPPAHAPSCLPPLPTTRAPLARLPADACDCHFHVFGSENTFSFVDLRSYTPPPCAYSAYRAIADALGIRRGVVVQPSVYGTDNRLLLETLASDRAQLRGVAVVAAQVADHTLADFHDAGVRGLRINLCQPGPNSLADIGVLGRRVADMGWHIQLHVDLGRTDSIEAIVRSSPVPIVIDHFGMILSRAAPSVIASLDRALSTRRCWVKLSAPYRCVDDIAPCTNFLPFVQSLIEHHGERLLWGTDWPHPGLFAHMPDDADLVDLLADWCEDARVREQILVSNPRSLYWQS
jgi:2-pyrone-4,6-dicarboxylate lactonase